MHTSLRITEQFVFIGPGSRASRSAGTTRPMMIEQSPSFLRWREIPASIWALGLVSLLMDVSSEMIHALLPLYLVTVLGASTLTVGVIEGIAEATASIEDFLRCAERLSRQTQAAGGARLRPCRFHQADLSSGFEHRLADRCTFH